MTLLWFVFGILLAIGIARYEQSNKLFWTLAVAFILGYAVTKMCSTTFGNESKDNTVQMYPTQVHVDSADICLLGADIQPASVLTVTESDPAGKDYTSDQNSDVLTYELVSEEIRDQPVNVLTNPPEPWLQKVISIPHDG